MEAPNNIPITSSQITNLYLPQQADIDSKTAALAASVLQEPEATPSISLSIQHSPLQLIEKCLDDNQIDQAERHLQDFIDQGRDPVGLNVWFLIACIKRNIPCLKIKSSSTKDRITAIHLFNSKNVKSSQQYIIDLFNQPKSNVNFLIIIFNFYWGTKDMEKNRFNSSFCEPDNTDLDLLPRETLLQTGLIEALNFSGQPLIKSFIRACLIPIKKDAVENFTGDLITLIESCFLNKEDEVKEIFKRVDSYAHFPEEVLKCFKLALDPANIRFRAPLARLSSMFFCLQVLKPTLDSPNEFKIDRFFHEICQIMKQPNIPQELLELSVSACKWRLNQGDYPPNVPHLTGVIYSLMKEPDLAAKYFLEAESKAHSDIASGFLADYYRRNGDYKKAKKFYEKITEKKRTFEQYLFLGICCLESRDIESALIALLKGLEINSKCSAIWFELATLQNLMGKHDAALMSINKGEEFNKKQYITGYIAISGPIEKTIALGTQTVIEQTCETLYLAGSLEDADQWVKGIPCEKIPYYAALREERLENFQLALDFIKSFEKIKNIHYLMSLKVQAVKIRCCIGLKNWEDFEKYLENFPIEFWTTNINLATIESAIHLKNYTVLKQRMIKLPADLKKGPIVDFARATIAYSENNVKLALNLMDKVSRSPIGQSDLFKNRLLEMNSNEKPIPKAETKAPAPSASFNTSKKAEQDIISRLIRQKQQEESSRLKMDQNRPAKEENAPFNWNDQIRLMKQGKFTESGAISTKRKKMDTSLAARAAAIMPESPVSSSSSSSASIEFITNGPITRPIKFDLNEHTAGDLHSAKRLLTYLEDTKNRSEISPEVRQNAMLFYCFRLCQTLSHLSPFKDFQTTRNTIRHHPDAISLDDLNRFVEELSTLRDTLDALLAGKTTIEGFSAPKLPESAVADKAGLIARIRAQVKLFDDYDEQLENKPHKLKEEGDVQAALQAAYLIIGKAFRKLYVEHGMYFKDNFIHTLIKNGNEAAHNLGERSMAAFADYEPLDEVYLRALLSNKKVILRNIN